MKPYIPRAASIHIAVAWDGTKLGGANLNQLPIISLHRYQQLLPFSTYVWQSILGLPREVHLDLPTHGAADVQNYRIIT